MLGYTDVSKQMFAQVAKDNADDPTGFRNLGYILLGERKYGDACTFFERALSLDPDDLMTYQALGYAEYMLGRNGSGKEKLRFVISREPDHPFANRYLGRVLMMEGHYQEALSHFRLARTKRPDFFEIDDTIQKLAGCRGE